MENKIGERGKTGILGSLMAQIATELRSLYLDGYFSKIVTRNLRGRTFTMSMHREGNWRGLEGMCRP